MLSEPEQILPRRIGEGGFVLLEDLLGEHRQVDAPVAPDMAAFGLDVLIFVALRVPVVAQVDSGLIEEIGLAHTHPVEPGLAAEETGRLLGEIGIGLDLLSKGFAHDLPCTQMQTGREETIVIKRVGIEQADVEGVTATHGESADSTSGTALDGAVVGIDIIHDVHETLRDRCCGRLGRTSTAIAEARGVHTPRPLTRGSLAVGVTIRHDHDHGLGLTSCNQVVQDLCSTSEFAPCVLIASGTMQEVEHGVLAALVIAGRGIDGHAALHLQRGTGIPHLREVAMRHFVHTIEVTLVTLLVADNKDVGKRNNVAVHVDVGRILHSRHTVDVEGVTVHLRGEFVGSITPHAVLALFQGSHAWGFVLAKALHLDGLRGQEVACHLDLDGLRGKEIKGHCAVLVDDGRLNTGTVEEFLLCRGTHAAYGCKGQTNE